MSLGSPSLGVRKRSRQNASSCSGVVPCSFLGLRIQPGAIVLHRTPRFPKAAATERVSACSAAFEAEYAERAEWPMIAAVEDVLTIEPPPFSIIVGITC